MGLYQHHCVVATDSEDRILRIEQWVKTLKTGKRLFVVSDVVYNDYKTIVMFPDGGKRGGVFAENVDKIRKMFLEKLRENRVDFIYVSFGELGSIIEDSCD